MSSHSSRRDFLKVSAATASAFALSGGLRPLFAGEGEAKTKLKILVFGGTGLIGPSLVNHAVARGHTVTLFNRGKRNADLFPDLEKIRGDRDPAKDPNGLKQLEGRKFDVVFDDIGYFPRIVKAALDVLAPNVGQYMFVSSISCYADNSKVDQDETAACGTMPDPTVEDFQFYGPLKALCEQAVEAACPGKTTIVRPGYIVGPDDSSGRFTYWPVRIAKGGEVLVPGDPSDPVQIIDVRDLSEWMVHLAENKTMGVFNACGPEKRLTMKEMVEACKRAAGSDAKLTWVNLAFLTEHKLGGDGGFPIWAPFDGETKGFHTWSNARAVKAGLKFRSVEQTAKDTLAWYRTQPEAEQLRQMKSSGAMPEGKEADLLEQWHEAQGEKQGG